MKRLATRTDSTWSPRCRPKSASERVATAHSLQEHALDVGLAAKRAVISAAAATGFSAKAADTAAVGGCLLRSCQTQLAQCLGDAGCLQDLVCIQRCQGRPDERACEIRCGDQYEDKAVTIFNACALSEKQCVPQYVTADAYPLPDDKVLDETFDMSQFQGRWYITAGYNKLFDIFDCQEHFFDNPEPGKMFGKINWRIQQPSGDFLERSTVQRFIKDPASNSKLYNRDNEYLHYKDDWYVVAWKPDEYAFIYYRGSNDAWDGYGGATVYTRAASFPDEYIPAMRKAAADVGLSWDDFTITDNSCPPHPPQAAFPLSLFQKVQQLEARFEKEMEKDLISFGRGFTVVQSDILRELTAEEKLVEKELKSAAEALEKIEQEYLGKSLAKLKGSK